MVDALGVLPQGEFHGRRGADHHIVNTFAIRLNGGELPADRIGAPRPRQDRCDARLPRLLEAAIERIDRIDGAQLWRARVGILIAVIALKAQPVLKHTQVGVRIDESRIERGPLRVNHTGIPLRDDGIHGAGLTDFRPLDADKLIRRIGAVRQKQRRIDNDHKISSKRKRAEQRPARSILSHISPWNRRAWKSRHV